MNSVREQMRANGKIQIVAQKPGSMERIRITGVSEECGVKQRMLDECPAVKQMFDKTGSEHFLMFKVKIENAELK